VLLLRAMVLGRMGEADAALAVLERMAAAHAPRGPAKWLEKGRLLDRMGRYEEAFAAFDADKQRLREVSGQTYLDAHAQHLAARLKNFFIEKRLAALPRAARRRATDICARLSALRYDTLGTDLERPRAHRRRR
jgi:tetratricopeptide (TPR) repeat protein